MLVLSRKKGETIVIGDDIEIVVLETDGEQIKIGIKAPRDVQVYRQEVYLAIKQSNQDAAKSEINLADIMQIARKKE